MIILLGGRLEKNRKEVIEQSIAECLKYWA